MFMRLIGLSLFLGCLVSCNAAPTGPPSREEILRDLHKSYTSSLENKVPEWRYNEEKARSLNFQRLLMNEERRTGDLETKIKQMSEELKTLREHCPQHNLP
jgi:hypothetical protein